MDWVPRLVRSRAHKLDGASKQLETELGRTPTNEEVEYARKLVRLDKEAATSGRGSWSLDGKMIDIPIIVRAQKLIKRFEAIKAREAKTLAAI